MTQVLHDLLYMIPICLAVTGLSEPWMAGPSNSLIIHVCAIVTLGICVIVRYWKSRLKYLLPGGVLVLGLGLLLTRSPGEWGGFLWDNRWLFITAAAALLSFFAGWVMSDSRLVRRVLFVLMLAALILVMIFITEPGKALVDITLFLLVIIVVDEVQYRWKKSGYPDRKGHLVSIASFLLILGVVVYLIPAPENPYDWDLAIQAWEKITDAAKWVGSLFSGGDDDYGAVIGFSDSGSYWGDLTKTDDVVMTLSGNKTPGAVVYLRGKVLDTFDGRDWSSAYTDVNRDDMMDSLETICSVNHYDPAYFGNYLRRVDLKLRYGEFNTRYFFAPLKTMLRSGSIGEEPYTQEGGDLLSEDGLGFGTEYAVSYYRMNQDNDVFADFLRSARVPDEKSWETTRARNKFQDASGDYADDTTYADYLAYRERIRTYYLPETKLSAGAEEYMTSLLSGAQTDYDKLCRIEEVLSGFHYTDSPGGLSDSVTTPEGFIDEFLFHKKEGFCSYFATAFVLMARSQGIPARYVQGFQVKTKGESTVEVRSDMSHAWPEAYIDGAGWVAFEPTPGHKVPVSWQVSDPTGHIPDYTEDKPVPEAPDIPEPDADEPGGEPETNSHDLSIVWILAGLLVVFLLAALLIDRITTASRFKRMDERTRFRVICRKNFAILALLGFRLEPGETLEEFHDRTLQSMGTDGLTFVSDCELVAYAGRPIDTGILCHAMEDQETLFGQLKEEKGRRYYWYRYRISRIDRPADDFGQK